MRTSKQKSDFIKDIDYHLEEIEKAGKKLGLQVTEIKLTKLGLWISITRE